MTSPDDLVFDTHADRGAASTTPGPDRAAPEVSVTLGDVERILFAGDTHGNVHHTVGLVEFAPRCGAQLVIVVGDFGYWTHTPSGRHYLAIVERAAARVGVPVWFIDGNHENHDALAARAAEVRRDGGDSVFVDVTGNGWVRWITRGARATIAGRTFGFLGGAFSIDVAGRTPGIDWWPGEEPTEADLDRLGTDPLDVLVTHDAPAGFALVGFRIGPDLEHRSYAVRRLLAEAVDRTRPALVVCGHWHRRVTETITHPDDTTTRVEILDCDGTGGRSWTVLDVAELRVIAPAAALEAGTSPGARGS